MNGDSPKNNYVLPETTALVVIGGLDLITTIYVLATHKGHEANPLFVSLLDNFGPIGFIVFKAVLLAVPLTIAELARKHNPDFVQKALRVGLVLYVLLYLLAFLRNNIH